MTHAGTRTSDVLAVMWQEVIVSRCMTEISINIDPDYLFLERLFKLGTSRMPARYVTLRNKLSVGIGTSVRVNETTGGCKAKVKQSLDRP